MMFALLALSSGSAISSNMSWAEFRAVFSWLGTAGLVFGVAHQALWGVILHKHRPNPSFWVAGGTIVSFSFPPMCHVVLTDLGLMTDSSFS